MKLLDSIYLHIMKYGNTPVGLKTWLKRSDDILAFLFAKGIEVTSRVVEETDDDYYSGLLTSFVVLERKKKNEEYKVR